MRKFISCIILTFLLFDIACKYDNKALDCSTISGARFNSNGGKIESLIINKCSGAPCHSTGGSGSIHWVVGAYETLGDHFFEVVGKTVLDGTMPPTGSPKLTSTELDLFECWKDSNYPK
jgi:hypothetical protein